VKRKHAGQTEIPLPGAIGFAHDPDETFAAEYGRDKMEAQRAAYIAERACTCGSPKPGTWGRARHAAGCPRAGRRF
jgi:hypothetical protein